MFHMSLLSVRVWLNRNNHPPTPCRQLDTPDDGQEKARRSDPETHAALEPQDMAECTRMPLAATAVEIAKDNVIKLCHV